jgi:site-specific DNA recombinase
MNAVGVYARISSDVLGEGLGVARQQKDCAALAERHGWTVVDTYVDNDVSAFSGKRRPQYERLLADVRSGRVSGIIAWHTDRLHRSPKELEAFIDLVESTKCSVDTVQAGELDLSTPSGRVMARTLGAFARYESEHKSARIRRKLEQNAVEGRHHGGERPFGWNPDRTTLCEPEAESVRFAIAQVIAGASLRGIAKVLNERGKVNADGAPWSLSNVRFMVIRPHNAGLRTYHGEIVGQGQWEPIVSREDWDAARRILTDPARRTNGGTRARVHLLSGVSQCGICGGNLRGAQAVAAKGRKRGIYRCGDKGCLARDQRAVDEYVTAVICGRLMRPDAVDLLRPPSQPTPDYELEAGRLRTRLSDAADDYAEDVITREQLRSITGRLRPRIEALEAMTPPPTPSLAALASVVGSGDVENAWAALDLKQKKELIALLTTITLLPTTPGPGFHPEHVRIEWKGQA